MERSLKHTLLYISVLLTYILLPQTAETCSNFRLTSTKRYHLSVRTNDQNGELIRWKLITAPRNSTTTSGRYQKWNSKYGAVYAVPFHGKLTLPFKPTAGLNEKGLSCDSQTLNGLWTQYPKRRHDKTDLSSDVFCVWVLANFASVAEVERAIKNVNLWIGYINMVPEFSEGGEHFIVRDAQGQGIVVEFLKGKTVVMKETIGAVTNEPDYEWHKSNVKHFMWKQGLKNSAVALPGNFYPDERLLRIHVLLNGLKEPKTFREAFMQAGHILNSVTVPGGEIIGIDTKSSGGNPTVFALIYDHDSPALYWREMTNQNWQRLNLKELNFTPGSKQLEFQFNHNGCSWANDALPDFTPMKSTFAVTSFADPL